MRVLWLDAFHAGSHRSVASGYAAQSQHDVTVLGMNAAGGWRWRMRGAAITFGQQIMERWGMQPLRELFDVIVLTDMLDCATWLGLNRERVAGVRTVLYMHENQLVYPLPEGRQRDVTWAWINYTSLLAVDRVLFNSAFHRDTLLSALPSLPLRYHDYHEHAVIDTILPKSAVLYPGIDLQRFDHVHKPVRSGAHTILWNSRWDYDKQPLVFFAAIEELIARGNDIRLIVLGEYVDQGNDTFNGYRERLSASTLHWGYVADARTYAEWLHQADLVVSCAIQEFFGIAVLEAVYCGAVPVLPRRLAYPELLPVKYHDLLLYDDDTTLVTRLESIIAAYDDIDRAELQQWARQYDWNEQIDRYDELIAGGLE